MTYKYLYIIDPPKTLNPKSDTTLALLEEAQRRGRINYACEIKDIYLNQGRLFFMASLLTLEPPSYQSKKQAMSADEFKIIFMRKDPPVNENFWSALLKLRCYNKQHTRIINEPDGLLLANEKLFGLCVAPNFFPPTLVSSEESLIRKFISDHNKIVLKPLFSAGGSGILILDSKDKNLSSALELISYNFNRPIIVQAFIANARQGDKRILLLGGKPLGACLRVPAPHDHRANFHAGGLPQGASLSARDHEIIEVLRPHLLALGLNFVGIDIIDGFLTEINVTSPTCLLEMEQLSGVQLRKIALDYIEQLI